MGGKFKDMMRIVSWIPWQTREAQGNSGIIVAGVTARLHQLLRYALCAH